MSRSKGFTFSSNEQELPREQRNKLINILIVDDSEFARTHLSKMVSTEFYNIAGEASNAQEALKIIAGKEIHIALLDVVMPEISGIQLAEQIRENFKNVRVVMVSSLYQERVIIEAIGAGALDFLQKPVNQDTLRESLDKIASQIEVRAPQ